MAKDNKKQGYNANPNKNRNIKKQSPHSQRGGNNPGQKGRQQRGGSQGRDGNRKSNLQIPQSTQFQLPPMKQRTVPPPPSTSSHPSNMSSSKKVQQARPEQVQQVLTHLKALQNVLNSYQELEMDKNANIKTLVQAMAQKAGKLLK